MVHTTRRSFLTGLAGLFASLTVPEVSLAAPTKAPSVPSKRPPSESEKLAKLYAPLCQHLETNTPFCHEDKGAPAIGCGVHFKGFSKLNGCTAIKITPKKGASLRLDKDYIGKLIAANWKVPKTKLSFPEIEKVEQIKLENLQLDKGEDWKTKLPTTKTTVWGKPLFWMPNQTLDKSNACAAEFFIQKAQEIHENIFQFPPSVRLVIVDLIYNVGDSGYGKEGKFPKFKEALRAGNYEVMKEECKTLNNKRRNTVRQMLIESAQLANKGLAEDKIKKNLRKTYGAKMSTVCERGIWNEIDKCTKENCAWKRTELAKQKAKIIARS